MTAFEERTEQTAPSFMPVIKPAVGGKSVGKRQRGCERGLVQDCHLVARRLRCRAGRCTVLCFMAPSVVTVCSEQDRALILCSRGDSHLS